MTYRPAMPESETPETDALVARWADMAKQPADLTFTQLHDLIEQVVKEILKSHEDLERRLAQAQVKLEEADTALRIRSTECLMQSQRAAQAKTRIAELEKDAARYRLARDHNHGVCFWTEFAKPLWRYEQAADDALDSALKART